MLFEMKPGNTKKFKNAQTWTGNSSSFAAYSHVFIPSPFPPPLSLFLSFAYPVRV
jgi:hypothetical protein